MAILDFSVLMVAHRAITTVQWDKLHRQRVTTIHILIAKDRVYRLGSREYAGKKLAYFLLNADILLFAYLLWFISFIFTIKKCGGILVKLINRRACMSYKNYNIYQGVKKVKTKSFLAISGAAMGVTGLLVALAMPLAAKAAPPTFSLSPWTFVGAAGECGADSPPGTASAVVSKWDSSTGNPSPSLFLQKNAPTADCSSAGATVNGVTGITLSELNFQYDNANGGHCGAGAPRYNVVTNDNVTHFFGCASGTQTVDPSNSAWTDVSWDPTNPAQAFPVITAGETVQSIDLVFDEGTDQGSGFVNLDNFSINNQVIGGPSTLASKDTCKNDGWKTSQDSNGNSFKNQGLCVSWVEHNVLDHGTPSATKPSH
jgi:hypothetical protein